MYPHVSGLFNSFFYPSRFTYTGSEIQVQAKVHLPLPPTRRHSMCGPPTFSVKTIYGLRCHQLDLLTIKFSINLLLRVLANTDNLCLGTLLQEKVKHGDFSLSVLLRLRISIFTTINSRPDSWLGCWSLRVLRRKPGESFVCHSGWRDRMVLWQRAERLRTLHNEFCIIRITCIPHNF